MRYPIVLKRDETAIMVTFPDIPEAGTQSDTQEGALREAVDALETALDGYFEHRRKLPMPSPPRRGQRTVDLAASTTAKVLLFNELLEQNVRPTELAQRMNVSKSEMTRILDPRHTTKIDTIAAAFDALGKHLELQVV